MKRFTIAALVFVLGTGMAVARHLHVLGGFRIGQQISIAVKELGTPYKVVPFADGFRSHVFVGKGHYVIFQTNPQQPDLIWSIQLTGLSNQAECGLAGVNLGDGKDKITATFGQPDEMRHAVDEFTKKKLETVMYYSYTQSRNFSLEVKDNKVSSIKVQYAGPSPEPGAVVSALQLAEMASGKNYYGLCSLMSADFSVILKNRTYTLDTAPLTALQKNPVYQTVFFDKQRGLPALRDAARPAASVNLTSPDTFDAFFRYMLHGRKFELCFAKNHEGYVLKHIAVD